VDPSTGLNRAAIWFSSLSWPTGGASQCLAFPVSRGRAGKRCVAAEPAKWPIPRAAGGSLVHGLVRCLGGESERVVVRCSFFARFYEASGASALSSDMLSLRSVVIYPVLGAAPSATSCPVLASLRYADPD
jgi:hypothetical protein